MVMIGHIHLDEVGLSHDADDAPSHRWGVVERQQASSIQATVHRSASGHTYFAKAVDSNDDPVQHKDWTYRIRCTPTELEYLVSLLGKVCELIDNDHVADGTDHLAYIQDVGFAEISNIENIGPMAAKYNVTIGLVDLENPA